MWAGAATTTPAVIGPFNWGFTNYSTSAGNMSALTMPKAGGGTQAVNTVQTIEANITEPMNTTGIFAITGFANTWYSNPNGQGPILPFTGSMVSILSNNLYSGGANAANTYGYIVTFYIGTTVIVCNVSSEGLSGPCTNSNGQTFNIYNQN